MSDNEKLYSHGEVVEELGLSDSHLNRKTHETNEFVRIGNRIFYTRDNIEAIKQTMKGGVNERKKEKTH